MSQITATRPEPFLSEGSSPPAATSDPPGFRPGFTGLRCRNCDTPQETAPVFVCPRCFGPLEATYDLDSLRGRLDRATLDARPASIWRYAELLPIETIPTEGVRRRALAPRADPSAGRRPWASSDCGSRTTPATPPCRSRTVSLPAARHAPSQFGFTTLACASTGNLAPAVAAAAAAIGLDAVVFIPADLEAVKVAQAQALGATVVRVDGPYDAVNRLCLELTGEQEDWAVVNVNLRPFYAEGSKTIAYEIAQQLGWRTPGCGRGAARVGIAVHQDRSRLRGAGRRSGSSTRRPSASSVARRPGCGPIASAWADGADVVTPVERPDTIVRSLAIGSPADGPYALKLARKSGGSIHGVTDAETVDSIRLLARTEGILTETAGGVTLAALRRAIAAGTVGRDDEVVLVITGNGLKTLEVLDDGVALPEPIAPTYEAFESWWESRSA